MKHIISFIFTVLLLFLSVSLISCSEDRLPESRTENEAPVSLAEKLSADTGMEPLSETSGTEAETKELPKPRKPRDFTNAREDYFSDALFIGDSRTVGLRDYAPLDGADYFATVGMSVYNVHKQSAKMGDLGSLSLEQLLSVKQYGKIYLMLGINELGYARNATVEKYKALLDEIRSAQPDAIIFIEANLHVTASRSMEDEVINNPEINDFNQKISAFADAIDIFYIDINEAFDDRYGNLRSDYTIDDTHLGAEQYLMWDEWLKTKAITD